MSNNSKLTLIVDGNWLFMSRMAVLLNKIKNVDDLCNELELLMVKSIKLVLRNFPDIDNIVFVSDGGSWRKNIDISEIEEALKKLEICDVVGYKETRVHSDEIDWEYVFDKFNKFQQILEDHNITTCHEHHIEGDDWAWYWSTILNASGTNTIIWTKDNDLKQLVNTDTNGCFTVWWNKDNGLFKKAVDENEMHWFFNNEYSENDQIMNNVIKKSSKVTDINPYDIVVEKIFMGDLGDNILPLAMRSAKNPESHKKFRISRKDINYDIDINDDAAVRNYFLNLMNNKSYVNRIINNDIELIMKHFDFNKKMVWLNKSQYPEEVLNEMKQHKLIGISKDINMVESLLQSRANDVENILENI